MIAYEELEKALARWKARRASGVEAPVGESGAVVAAAETSGDVSEEGPPTGPAVVAAETYQRPDSTGEIDLADAEVTDA